MDRDPNFRHGGIGFGMTIEMENRFSKVDLHAQGRGLRPWIKAVLPVDFETEVERQGQAIR